MIFIAAIILALYFCFRYREKKTGDSRYAKVKYVTAGAAVALALYIVIRRLR